MQIAVAAILAAMVLALLGVAMGWVLGWANRAFHVEVDPKVEAINNALPGANCGGCGYVGCAEYAEAVAGGAAALDLCGPGGASCVKSLGAIMGVEVGQTWPYKAVVHCAATGDQRLKRIEYDGEPTCAAANLVSGVQGCTYGCLGLADCVVACDYDAIHIVDELAKVTYDKCVGCKACAIVCPRNIITMVPFKREQMLVVACSNEDFGKDVKEVCTVGCIGCKACTLKNDLLHMEGKLPVVDYGAYDPDMDLQPILDKCQMESLIFVGTPSARDLRLTAEEELPERVKAKFETTVDDTEWRG